VNPLPFGHHLLSNRYCFTGPLVLETPLRVSSGRADDDTDAPIMRRLDGVPYIPGSSLRGALRSELERLLAAVGQETSGLTGCTSFTKESCAEKIRESILKNEEMEAGKRDRTELIQEFVASGLCDLCRLFGFPEFASRLVIEDALPDPLDTAIKAPIRDGVGIDRDTGAARETVKFNYQVIETGPRFTFKMVVENIQGDEDRTLITLILQLLRQGLYVGGKRAAGLGKVRLTACEIWAFENPTDLWNRLLHDQDLYTKVTWPEVPLC